MQSATRTAFSELSAVEGGASRWNGGFFADLQRKGFGATHESIKMALWHKDNSAAFENFRTTAKLKDERAKQAVARGLQSSGGAGDWSGRKDPAMGLFQGTSWSDGDCYKYMEGLSRLYATLDPGAVRDGIKKELDELIPLVAAAQEEDGYLQTQITIPRRTRWITRRFHEDYNLGHLFTAGAVHYAATGETSFLDIARKAAVNAYGHFILRQRDAGSFGWNPTHIPGLVDLYRATGDARFLELAQVFLDRRGSERAMLPEADDTQGPDDENQMAVAFRDESEAVGHAVTAGYLCLGASEIYRETGEAALLDSAKRIWRDIVRRKLYITGAVGALPVGISKRGHKVFEAFGREYQLPHRTAYNETCANITWGMFCRSMFAITGEAEYADEMERLIYNAGISGMSAKGDAFNYANPLRWYTKWDTSGESFGTMRHFSHDRWQIHTCYCCPPQAFRFAVQLNEWAYYTSGGTLTVALYGSGSVSVDVPGAGKVRATQRTSYPWDGTVELTIDEAPGTEFALSLRIPGWASGAGLKVNGEKKNDPALESGGFVQVRRVWKSGDVVELSLPLGVRFIAADPKVEECRGQVAVMRGPIVYCAESIDLPDGVSLEDVSIHQDSTSRAEFDPGLLGGIVPILARGQACSSDGAVLYRDTSKVSRREIELKLIPYYAWRNRGRADMTVWFPAVGEANRGTGIGKNG